MKRGALALLAGSCLFVGGCSSTAVYCKGTIACQVEDLGHGFKYVVRSEETVASFESVGHFAFLYYKETSLGQVGRYSVAPSGRFALYEFMGTLQLFDAESETATDVTDPPFAVPSAFRWAERERVVTVKYFGDHKPSDIPLPE